MKLTQAQKDARKPLNAKIRSMNRVFGFQQEAYRSQIRYLQDKLHEVEESLQRVLRCEPGTKPWMDAQNAKGSNAYEMGKVKAFEGIGPTKAKGIQ